MATISSNASANRVVSLNGLGPRRSPGHRILNECRDQLVSELCLWLRDIAAPVSEELFVQFCNYLLFAHLLFLGCFVLILFYLLAFLNPQLLYLKFQKELKYRY